MAVVKSLVISLALVILNVYINWFITFELTKHELLDTNIISVPIFRIVIGICQISGSLLCLALVDFIERKVYSIFLDFSISIYQQIQNLTIFSTVFAGCILSWCNNYSNYVCSFRSNSRNQQFVTYHFDCNSCI